MLERFCLGFGKYTYAYLSCEIRGCAKTPKVREMVPFLREKRGETSFAEFRLISVYKLRRKFPWKKTVKWKWSFPRLEALKKVGKKRPILTESSFVSHGSMEEVHGYRRSSSERAVYCMGQKAFFARSPPPRELFLSSPEKQSMRERGTRLSSETKNIFPDLAHPHRIGERELG